MNSSDLVKDFTEAVKQIRADTPITLSDDFNGYTLGHFYQLLSRWYDNGYGDLSQYHLYLGNQCTTADADDYDLGYSDADIRVFEQKYSRNPLDVQAPLTEATTGNNLFYVDFHHCGDFSESENGLDVPAFKLQYVTQSYLLYVIFKMCLDNKDFMNGSLDNCDLTFAQQIQVIHAFGFNLVGYSIPVTVKYMRMIFKKRYLMRKHNHLNQSYVNNSKQYNDLVNQIKDYKANASQLAKTNLKKHKTQLHYLKLRKQATHMLNVADSHLNK